MTTVDARGVKSGQRRRYRAAALLGSAALVFALGAVVLALGVTGVFSSGVSSDSVPTSLVEKPPVSIAPTTTTTVFTVALGTPSRVVIPVIRVNAKLVPVGLKSNGDMQTPPYGRAGWFKYGPVPGAAGPAVIVGHVDTRRKPDVFYRLKELEAGDEFYVLDTDGESATFAVDYTEMVLKDELPTERIWPVTDRSVIALVTCGGEWDRASGHYLSNVIVYGHLVR